MNSGTAFTCAHRHVCRGHTAYSSPLLTPREGFSPSQLEWPVNPVIFLPPLPQPWSYKHATPSLYQERVDLTLAPQALCSKQALDPPTSPHHPHPSFGTPDIKVLSWLGLVVFIYLHCLFIYLGGRVYIKQLRGVQLSSHHSGSKNQALFPAERSPEP